MPRGAVGPFGMRAVAGGISGSAGGCGLRRGRCFTIRPGGIHWRISCAYFSLNRLSDRATAEDEGEDDTHSSKTQSHGATIRQLDFTPMDAFMTHVLEAFRLDAEKAVIVFPPGAKVILSFADRVANDVVRLVFSGWRCARYEVQDRH